MSRRQILQSHRLTVRVVVTENTVQGFDPLEGRQGRELGTFPVHPVDLDSHRGSKSNPRILEGFVDCGLKAAPITLQ